MVFCYCSVINIIINKIQEFEFEHEIKYIIFKLKCQIKYFKLKLIEQVTINAFLYTVEQTSCKGKELLFSIFHHKMNWMVMMFWCRKFLFNSLLECSLHLWIYRQQEYGARTWSIRTSLKNHSRNLRTYFFNNILGLWWLKQNQCMAYNDILTPSQPLI